MKSPTDRFVGFMLAAETNVVPEKLAVTSEFRLATFGFKGGLSKDLEKSAPG